MRGKRVKQLRKIARDRKVSAAYEAVGVKRGTKLPSAFKALKKAYTRRYEFNRVIKEPKLPRRTWAEISRAAIERGRQDKHIRNFIYKNDPWLAEQPWMHLNKLQEVYYIRSITRGHK